MKLFSLNKLKLTQVKLNFKVNKNKYMFYFCDVATKKQNIPHGSFIQVFEN